MRALADLAHTHVKLSMLYFGCNGYHEDPDKEAKVCDLVLETVETFGVDRCMFATNYPVDRMQGIDIPTLYGQYYNGHLTCPRMLSARYSTTRHPVYTECDLLIVTQK